MTLAAPVTADVAQLTIDGTTYELPIVEGTEGERGIDISRLRADTGLITLDPGYANTGSTLSEITLGLALTFITRPSSDARAR